MFFGLDLNLIPVGWIIGVIASIGLAIGLMIAYFASREYIKRTIEVLHTTIKSLEENIKAKDELAASLFETNKQHNASLESKLETMTGERDGYRDKLHATVQPMQALTLELQELKLRPDLNQVLLKEEAWHSRREEFYTTMAQNQHAIIDTQREGLQIQREIIRIIGEIKTNVEAELKQSTDICAEVGKALQEVLLGFTDRDNILIEIRDLLKNPRLTAASEKENGDSHEN
jgi:hypothetical protein